MAAKITSEHLRVGLTRLRDELMTEPRAKVLQVLAIDDLLTSAESVARLAAILDSVWGAERGPKEGPLDMATDYSAEVFPTQDGLL